MRNPNSFELVEDAHRVRPTSGLEFVSSRHFPEEYQGDILLCNAIGFLGIKHHTMKDDGTGYQSTWQQDLVQSTDGNFRPVDLEFAPDGQRPFKGPCAWQNIPNYLSVSSFGRTSAYCWCQLGTIV
jgi:hypothetical protein